ncbi:MAG: RNA polymerase sporulation sigma factor SigH [Armatimonadetes bacterium]|nr:RNA polymerase sporulation sigma factor SigH [Armatimonadota bacterium]
MISVGIEDPVFYSVEYDDEDVVRRARQGDIRAAERLIARYRPLVETKARTYFLMGADPEDVVQEGMIGLFKAIRDFRCDRKSKFRPFAELCVTRQIITAVKTATRQKHSPLNGYISLSRSLSGEDSDGMLLDILPDAASVNPEEVVLSRKVPRNLHEAVKHLLSDLESRVLRSYLEGKTYREMSQELQCRPKSIDNALQRVKRKIHNYMHD